MRSVVADTHAIVWFIDDSPLLSNAGRAAMEAAIAAGDPVFISAITLVELTYLSEKGRLPASIIAAIQQFSEFPDSGLVIVPLDTQVAIALAGVSRNEVPDLPDRIIAATAVHLGVPLVTRDDEIRASSVPTIW